MKKNNLTQTCKHYKQTGLTISFGSGFLTLLTLIFVVAKLWGKIDWSWLLVFSPILIGVGIGILVLVIFFIMILIAFLQ